MFTAALKFRNQKRIPMYDAFASSTALLVHGHGINNSTAFIDSTLINSLLNVGAPIINTAVSKFGKGSIYLNGSSYVSIPYTTALTPSDGFTLEFWVYALPQVNGNPRIISNMEWNSTQGWDLSCEGGQIIFFCAGGNGIGVPYSLDANWHHFAFTRSGTTFRSFKDGVLSSTTSITAQLIPQRATFIGAKGINPTGTQFKGYIEDMRITKACRYVSNFAVPTAPFSLYDTSNISARYWRVLQIADSYQVGQLKEMSSFSIGMFSSKDCTGIDLCLGKTAIASSQYSTSYQANYALDGNTISRWGAAQGQPTYAWWRVDMGSPVSVNSFNWQAFDAFIGKALAIQYSFDDIVWNTYSIVYPPVTVNNQVLSFTNLGTI